jgi:release factor glutamine methyltransferase
MRAAGGEVTVAEALRAATQRLGGSDSPRLDAEVLLAASLAVPRTQLYREPERILGEDARARFDTLLGLRRAGKPVPYLTGRAEFWSLELEISEDVLVPRPETELLVECALALRPAARPGVFLDLGTGSGAVAAALAVECPDATVIATDRSLAAVRLARRNFVRLGLGRIGTVCADWLAAVDARSCDLIAANPPYVAERDRSATDVATRFEPQAALYAGDDGLAAITAIVRGARTCLRATGVLALEHGSGQGEAVRALLAAHGFAHIGTRQDLAGHDRVTHGRRP